MQAHVSGNVTKQRLPTLLDAWAEWGRCQSDLCQHAQRLCTGPRQTVEVFDRATIQGVSFSTTATEGKNKSRDSVVLMKVSDRYWAGRVLFFLGHTPPGVDVGCESTVFIADVKWYNHVPQRQALSPALGSRQATRTTSAGTCGLFRSLLLANLLLCATASNKTVLCFQVRTDVG